MSLCGLYLIIKSTRSVFLVIHLQLVTVICSHHQNKVTALQRQQQPTAKKKKKKRERKKQQKTRVHKQFANTEKKIFIYNVKMELGTEWDKAKCHKPKWASYTYIGLNMWLSRGGERHRLRQSRVGEWVSSLRFCVSFQLRVYWPSFGDLNEI